VVVTSPACGDVVTVDVRLEVDLACSGDALTIFAYNVTINLNGHVIAGNGTGNGIKVVLSNGVTVKGGTVRNFFTGIYVEESTNVTVKDNSLTQNRDAVLFAGSSYSVVKSNIAWDNTQSAIWLGPSFSIVSTGNVVVENILMDNSDGIVVFGQSGNTLKGNSIYRGVVGINLAGGGGTGTEIKDNLLTESVAGIRFRPGWASGNAIIGNTFSFNRCGTLGPGASNTYTDNAFFLNTTNICP